jgi:cysteinyl-tRNA synthetase
MEDDLNTPEALAAIFDLIRDANKDIWNLSAKEARLLRKWLHGLLITLGFKDLDTKISSRPSKLARKREISRANKQFAQSDTLRKEIEALGYSIEDTPLGPLVLPR